MSATIPALTLLGLLSSSPVPAAEQAIPATVRSGLKVAVVDERGASVEGRVQEVSGRFVRLTVRGNSRDIPVAEIVRIERPDTVKNGALIGLGIGIGTGLIATLSDPRGGAVLVSRVLGNGLVCAGIGALIDAAQDHRRTLYERGPRPQARVQPVIGRQLRAVAVSLEW
jgi:hypothetical protein